MNKLIFQVRYAPYRISLKSRSDWKTMFSKCPIPGSQYGGMNIGSVGSSPELDFVAFVPLDIRVTSATTRIVRTATVTPFLASILRIESGIHAPIRSTLLISGEVVVEFIVNITEAES